MKPARTSQRLLGETRMLVLANDGRILHSWAHQIATCFDPGDLLIVNRSATLPSSFHAYLARTGEDFEIRLAAFQGPDAHTLTQWRALAFGAGDWRIPTENRGQPPHIREGDEIILGEDLRARVLACEHSRLLSLEFVSNNLEQNLYRYGRPIQYSYLENPLDIWDQQTIFSGPPLSTEAPSASFPFTWDLILRLKQKGVQIATILHGAGISSTGSEALDLLLPLEEYYEIPASTVLKIRQAQRDRKRIIALGTSVLRAIETAGQQGPIVSGSGLTRLRLGPDSVLKVATGLITGMHELGSSHRSILAAFRPAEHIGRGYEEAEQRSYRSHEYGDICLLAAAGG
jgi:S-adenosylmethionine:tRNA ribosyltransferase-isomerase